MYITLKSPKFLSDIFEREGIIKINGGISVWRYGIRFSKSLLVLIEDATPLNIEHRKITDKIRNNVTRCRCSEKTWLLSITYVKYSFSAIDTASSMRYIDPDNDRFKADCWYRYITPRNTE